MYYLYNVENNKIVAKYKQVDRIDSLKENFEFETKIVEDSRDIPFEYWYRFYYNSETNSLQPL